MKEIEVGEYVRTKWGIIGKLVKQDLSYPEPSEWILNVNNKEVVIVECEDYPVKHSKNIINLIEVGDVIELNNEVYQVIYDESYKKLGVLIPNGKELAIRHSSLEFIFSKQGKQKFNEISIATKEQFKNAEYRV